MRRKYTLEEFKKKIEEIRSIQKDISISTDIIVGFPGETEELFEQSIKTCKEIGFSKLHVFPYSERKGTLSSKMDGKIEESVKKARARKLIEVSKELEIKYMEKFIGKEVEVLIEEEKEGFCYGHTGNYLHVRVKDKYPHNEIVKVTIKKVNYPYCEA